MPTVRKPKFLDSPYFVDDPFNWHLKEGAPKGVKKEFRDFMKSINKFKIRTDKKKVKKSLSKLKLVIDLNKGRVFREEDHIRDAKGKFTRKYEMIPTDVRFKDENGNYKPERLKLHNAIVDEINKTAGKSEKKPVAFLMGGGSATGKSTLREVAILNNLKKDGKSAGIVDCDDIKKAIPEYKTLHRTVAAKTVHDESSDVTVYALNTLIAQKKNLIFDGTMKNYDKYSSLIKQLKKEGYEVNIMIADCPLEVAIERSEKRAKETGRKVPVDIIKESHANVPGAFVKLKKLVDNYTVYDTSEKTPKLIHSQDHVDMNSYSKFLTKGNTIDPELKGGV